MKAIEEFFVFLCKVCNASFFFAHRVHWFLSAMINAAQEKKDDIIGILKMINTLFKSESQKKKELNTVKTDIFFNNILRKNDNNKYLNINESLKPPLKNKLIVMKIIKKITNNNSNNASKIKFKKSE